MLTKIIAYMTNLWFTQTWYQCQLLHIELSTMTHNFECPCKNDQELMRILIQHGIEGSDLASMNQCQMFLKVTYLSNICMDDGKYINMRYWEGKETCQTGYQWPRTEKLMTYEWNMWRKNLTNALSLGRCDSLGTPWAVGNLIKDKRMGYS